MTWSAPWYMILNKFDASTDWSTISSGFLCTNYMDMRSQQTNGWMKGTWNINMPSHQNKKITIAVEYMFSW